MSDVLGIFREIRGSGTTVNEGNTGIWYDLVKNPNIKYENGTLTGVTTTSGNITGGIFKAIKDGKTAFDASKADFDTKYEDIVGDDGNAGKYKSFVDKYNEMMVTDTNGHAGKYGDMVAKYNEIAVDDTNGNPGKYGDFMDKFNVVEPHLDPTNGSLVVVKNDLLANDSKVKEVANNLQKVNSEVKKVGDDLLDNNSKIEKVAEDLYDANSKIEVVGTDLIDDTKKYVQTVGADLKLGNSSKVKRVSDKIGKVEDVADDLTNVDTVANDIDEVRAVGEDLLGSYSHVKHALANAQKAEEWAEKLTEVENGKYSAKYWAQQASETVSGGIIDDGQNIETKVYSSAKTERIANALITAMMKLADASAIADVTTNGVLTEGDTSIQFDTDVQSDNLHALELDKDNELIKLKRNTSYAVIARLNIKADSAVTRVIELKLLDGDTVIASNSTTVSFKEDEDKDIEFSIGIDSGAKDLNVKLNIDGDSLNINGGKIYVMSSVSQDIDADVNTLYDGVGFDTNGYVANSNANYINNSASLKEADDIIDEKIKRYRVMKILGV